MKERNSYRLALNCLGIALVIMFLLDLNLLILIQKAQAMPSWVTLQDITIQLVQVMFFLAVVQEVIIRADR